MRHIAKLAIACLIVSSTVGATDLVAPSKDSVIRARASIQGAPGSGISGVVIFRQVPASKFSPVTKTEIVARIEGLTPGLHGMHIHETGDCTDTALSFGGAGGHFDPGPFGSSTPVDANHPFHMGDLPNLVVNEAGVGHLRRYSTSRITLSSGPLSVFDANGSAVIIHQNQDLGTTGVTGASGGPRIACGVIQLNN